MITSKGEGQREMYQIKLDYPEMSDAKTSK
jgi:hypothetical protein